MFPVIDDISPVEFETLIRSWFESVGHTMESFEATNLETLQGDDGEYTFDVTIRFSAFQGAQFLVLVKCKKHKNPIKREVIQVLYDRLRAVGSHKGFVVATTSFQSGAIEYAEKHGIALVQVVTGAVRYIRASAAEYDLPHPPGVPRFLGCHLSPISRGHFSVEFFGEDDASFLESLLSLDGKPEQAAVVNGDPAESA